METKKNSRDIIERYIYDVIRRIPQSQRLDMEMELRSLIEDMLEAGGDEGKSVEDVLEELGNPREFARKFRGEEKYIIGPEYYDMYTLVLKIVLICNFAGIIISGIVDSVTGIFQGEHSLPASIGRISENFGGGIISMVTAFGMVTLIFAVIEKQNIKVDKTGWNLDKLPEVPQKKALIRRGEIIVQIVFSLLFAGILIFVPQVFGAWFQQDGQMISIPLFNLDIWRWTMPLFLFCIVVSMVDACVQLVVGRYGTAVAISNIITNVLAFFVTVILLKCMPIWNPDFMTELEQVMGRSFQSDGDIMSHWGTAAFSNIVLAFFAFVFLLDMGTTLYKCLKYGSSRR